MPRYTDTHMVRTYCNANLLVVIYEYEPIWYLTPSCCVSIPLLCVFAWSGQHHHRSCVNIKCIKYNYFPLKASMPRSAFLLQRLQTHTAHNTLLLIFSTFLRALFFKEKMCNIFLFYLLLWPFVRRYNNKSKCILKENRKEMENKSSKIKKIK